MRVPIALRQDWLVRWRAFAPFYGDHFSGHTQRLRLIGRMAIGISQAQKGHGIPYPVIARVLPAFAYLTGRSTVRIANADGAGI